MARPNVWTCPLCKAETFDLSLPVDIAWAYLHTWEHLVRAVVDRR